MEIWGTVSLLGGRTFYGCVCRVRLQGIICEKSDDERGGDCRSIFLEDFRLSCR